MGIAPDPHPGFAKFAHPERLVTTEWVSSKLGTPGLRIIESDEDVLLYDVGHIPTAQKLDWHLHLNDPTTRDYVDGEHFAELMRERGISRDDTVVIYGDKNNWWAAYALWVFTLFGHPDVRLMDGGRDAWRSEDRDMTLDVPEYPRSDYPVIERDDTAIRAFAHEVRAGIGNVPMIDVRSPQEYTGERTHMPEYPEEGALRGGHIPSARSIPWAKAAAPDGRFKGLDDLTALYAEIPDNGDTIVYCRIGERSSHTWFVLTHLLGRAGVRNYDGSWTEWGNAVAAPIARGESPDGEPQPAATPE